MSTDRLGELEPGTVAVLGLPSDHNSSFLRGARLAPIRIREAFRSESSNQASETGIDLGAERRFCDLGDLELPSAEDLLPRVEDAISGLLERGVRVLSLGGDHALTYPIIKAYSRFHPGLELLQVDAHPDLYDEFEGNRHSHACPFARIMEQGLVGRLVQVGIRGMNPHQRAQAQRFGVDVFEMHGTGGETPELNLSVPVYVSIDLDALDPAFTPGVSHPEPGGLTTRQVIELIHRLPTPVVGADIVELNPQRDPVGLTAMVAAKLMKELAGQMLRHSADES